MPATKGKKTKNIIWVFLLGIIAASAVGIGIQQLTMKKIGDSTHTSAR